MVSLPVSPLKAALLFPCSPAQIGGRQRDGKCWLLPRPCLALRLPLPRAPEQWLQGSSCFRRHASPLAWEAAPLPDFKGWRGKAKETDVGGQEQGWAEPTGPHGRELSRDGVNLPTAEMGRLRPGGWDSWGPTPPTPTETRGNVPPSQLQPGKLTLGQRLWNPQGLSFPICAGSPGGWASPCSASQGCQEPLTQVSVP